MRVHYFKAKLTWEESLTADPDKVVTFKDPVSLFHSGWIVMNDPENGFHTALTFGANEEPGLFYSNQNRKGEFVGQAITSLRSGEYK